MVILQFFVFSKPGLVFCLGDFSTTTLTSKDG
jgi:hypothetical protein